MSDQASPPIPSNHSNEESGKKKKPTSSTSMYQLPVSEPPRNLRRNKSVPIRSNPTNSPSNANSINRHQMTSPGYPHPQIGYGRPGYPPYGYYPPPVVVAPPQQQNYPPYDVATDPYNNMDPWRPVNHSAISHQMEQLEQFERYGRSPTYRNAGYERASAAEQRDLELAIQLSLSDSQHRSSNASFSSGLTSHSRSQAMSEDTHDEMDADEKALQQAIIQSLAEGSMPTSPTISRPVSHRVPTERPMDRQYPYNLGASEQQAQQQSALLRSTSSRSQITITDRELESDSEQQYPQQYPPQYAPRAPVVRMQQMPEYIPPQSAPTPPPPSFQMGRGAPLERQSSASRMTAPVRHDMQNNFNSSVAPQSRMAPPPYFNSPPAPPAAVPARPQYERARSVERAPQRNEPQYEEPAMRPSLMRDNSGRSSSVPRQPHAVHFKEQQSVEQPMTWNSNNNRHVPPATRFLVPENPRSSFPLQGLHRGHPGVEDSEGPLTDTEDDGPTPRDSRMAHRAGNMEPPRFSPPGQGPSFGHGMHNKMEHAPPPPPYGWQQQGPSQMLPPPQMQSRGQESDFRSDYYHNSRNTYVQQQQYMDRPNMR